MIDALGMDRRYRIETDIHCIECDYSRNEEINIISAINVDTAPQA